MLLPSRRSRVIGSLRNRNGTKHRTASRDRERIFPRRVEVLFGAKYVFGWELSDLTQR